jgi:hypothetical protein
MSLESVRAFFHANAPDLHIIELATSTATVALAAEAHGVEPGQIAKTLAFRVGERNVLLVARGDARIDNKKIKDALGSKAKMLDAETCLPAPPRCLNHRYNALARAFQRGKVFDNVENTVAIDYHPLFAQHPPTPFQEH